MAASNAYSLSSESFKMPSEPCPLPSLGSDEESFVVLWKDLDDKALSEELLEPTGVSVIEEAKQLINKELLQIEESQNIRTDSKAEQSVAKDTQSGPQIQQIQLEKTEPASEKSVSAPKTTRQVSQMEQSTGLPKMPQVERGFDTSNVISITTLSTDWTSEEVQRKVAEIVEENIRLKDTILQNNMSMKSQYERIVAWQEDVQKVHQAHKDKIIEAKEFIERLKKENYNLTRDLDKLREIKNLQDIELASLKQTLKEKEQQTTEKLVQSTDNNMKEFELEISQKKVKELEYALQNMTLENSNLKEDKVQLVKGASRIDQYEKEIEKLQELLHASKLQVEEAKMELLKVKSLDDEKQKSLNEVIESMRSQLCFAAQQRAVPAEEMTTLRQQLTNAQIMLTQVEHSRAAAYAQIETLNKDLLELRKQLEHSPSQKDEMYALQTQLDVYKADFEAERTTKDTIKAENLKFSEDMQNLQRRNQQLQEEIEMLRERDFVVYPPQRRETTRAASSSSSSDSPPVTRYACPICNLQFRSLRLVEDHVETCICHRD